MALIAEDAQDRAEQLVLVTERLTALISEETRRIDARQPLLDGAEAEEKNRLANAYRFELARIGQDRSLIEGARPDTLGELKRHTVALHEALAAHELSLTAVKTVAEGLVHAIAEEVVRQRGGLANYGAGGAPAAPAGPQPAILDRSA
jgi:hypothetical protein